MATVAKPLGPTWQPGYAPAGCRLYLPLHEGAGKVVRDLSGRQGGGAIAGAPTWQRGPYGSMLGGFSTSNYVVLPPTPLLMGAAYPCWMATLAINSIATDGVTISQTSSSKFCWIRYNRAGSVGLLAFEWRADATGDVAITVGGMPLNDGLPHVAMILSFTPTDHRLYFDGRPPGGASTVTIGAFTPTRFTLGASDRGGLELAFPGSIVAAAAGVGAAPDPRALAEDWLSGRFAAVRPRRARSAALSVFFAPAPVDATATAGILSATGTAPAATATGGAAGTPPASVAAGTIPAPSPSGAAFAAAGVLAAAASLPAPSASGGASVATSPLSSAAALPAATGAGGQFAAPAAVAAAGVLPAATAGVIPPDLRQALVAFLRGSSALAAYSGTRIRPMVRAQSDVLPAISYRVVSEVEVRDLDGGAGQVRARVQVDCWAASLAAAAAMAQAVRSLMHGFRGEMNGLAVARADLISKADLHEFGMAGSGRDLYRISSDYLITYTATIPTF